MSDVAAFYVPLGDEDSYAADNPHVCLDPSYEDVPCLACALKEVMGEERWGEALDIAAGVRLLAVQAQTTPTEPNRRS